MFRAVSEAEIDGRCHHYRLFDEMEPLSYQTVLAHWKRNEAFREWFSDVLRVAPYDCYRWETPPVAASTLNRAFEFVLVDAPEINLPPDPSPFQRYFPAADQGVVTFENLGGDAQMVVPSALSEPDAYPHIAAFIRKAPAQQIDALWRAVGVAVTARISDKLLWLNTAGGGVAWLHVRLDSRPKYYAYRPFAQSD